MSKPQGNKQPSRKKKVTLWLVAIIMVIAIFLIIVPLVQSTILRVSLGSKSKETLKHNEVSLQSSLDDRITLMAEALGAGRNVTYDVTYDSCYVDHNDSGWFANSYNYKCILTKYGFYAVGDSTELRKFVELNAEPANQDIGTGSLDYYGKLYVINPEYKAVNPGVVDLPYEVYVVKDHTYANAKDVLAIGAVAHNLNVVAYASSMENTNRSVLREHGSQKLNTDQTYVVLQASEEYLHKDIGCRIPSILFCESPL